MSARNVVFIMTDQQHFRTLGCHGVAEAETPHLDALAAGGLDFHNHIVTNPVCMPSRASIISGRYINEHGVWQNGCCLGEDIPTLPQVLGKAGVQTAHIGKLHLEPIISRTEAPSAYGFEHCEIAEGDQNLINDAHWGWLRKNHPEAFLKYLNECFQNGHSDAFRSDLPEELHLSSWITSRAETWLREGRDDERPFYLSLGYFDPHHAFNPCEPWYSRFADKEVAAPRVREGEHDKRPPHYARQAGGGHVDNPDRINATIRSVHAMCAQIDHCVGRIVATLGELGLAKDTLIVFTSDHGEMLGNHRMLWKGPFLLDDLIRVPLVVAPADASGPGQVCPELTSGVDFMATMCRVFGCDSPDGDGTAIVDADLAVCPDGEREVALCEWEGGKFSEADQLRCVRTRTAKLVDYGDQPYGEYYDLAADPDEFNNAYSDPDGAQGVATMRSLLDKCYPAGRAATVQECQW
ncbi:MAG: sulfatase-like hydrolase/transferase [Planctomycetota bacterium]|jgi:arylsulfatase|nr:sulfatase-like hydrolase/transferase [Planctomycetota bacterium]